VAPGQDLFDAEVEKLPLLDIMHGERKGGWGKCFSGVDHAIEKLRRIKEYCAFAADLSTMLELAKDARKLQVPQVYALP
jgi:hypothetical protein